jgi:predicted MPP superfamily phosphohydrolase
MPKWSFVVFLVVLSALLYAVNRRALSWFETSFALGRRTVRALAVLLGASVALVVLGRIASLLFPNLPVSEALRVGFTVQLAVLVSMILLLPFDVALVVRRLSQRLRRATPNGVSAETRLSEPGPAQPEPRTPEPRTPEPVPRRAFLTQATVGSAFLIGSSSSLYGSLAGRHDYQLEDVPVRLPGLSRALDGFTIVQLSDIHVGQFVGDAELAAGEALVRRARPDLIVLTGDLLDHDPRCAQQLGRFARRVAPLAREGVVAISGNHDFYAGIDQVVSALEAGGADVLRNRGRVIGGRDGFALLGVDDVWGRRFNRGPDLSAALASLPVLAGSVGAARDLPRVLLCHNPSFFEESAPRVGLQLSGHTHGGQINLVVRPADWLLKNGWVAGLYRERDSQLYVNRGFGTAGPPARIGAPPEITRIVLTT